MEAIGPVTIDGVHPAVVKVIRRAFEENIWPIYIHGLPGRGKSAAAKVVFERFLGSKFWYSASELCRDIAVCRSGDGKGTVTRERNGFFWEESERGIWSKMAAYRFVVIDDLGRRAATESAYESLMMACDCRAGKPTIWTGNLPPVDKTGGPDLAKAYDSRLVSRICGGSVVEVRGPDRRLARSETIIVG